MAESPPTVSLPPHPNHMVPPIPSADPPHPLLRSLQSPPPPTPPPPPPPPTSGPIFFKRPSVRVTSEFDSDSSLFLHKVSCKLFDSLAKLKAKEGEVSMVAKLADPGYALELSTPVPTIGFKALIGIMMKQDNFSPPSLLVLLSFMTILTLQPRATFKFPLGEVSLEEREDEEVKRSLSVGGIVKGQMLNGLCTAQFNDEDLKLRYAYKDAELSFIPSISLPSNAVAFAFKRQISPNNKLSYWYNFDSNTWSAVYKHTYGKDYKFKAGYDSEVRLGWASLWVGDEGGKAKTAPMKMKVQFMLQVPQDDIMSSALMFLVKKRWDIL
ncbi:hypothetical protein GH714_031023 [Hevea brasiliensis]|uniref:Outer envelope pore protein 37, chloroplastic n=1 Tax=Hevea brasiliensis TaxID=3981 RepID=A0A6A6NKK4_HEVBR|nr:hypothetical protein GH714_031023 [Hevea brasiliensis]